MTLAIQRLCADCEADISERGRGAIRCFNCARRYRREYNGRFKAGGKPRYCKDCQTDISGRGSNAVRCVECQRGAAREEQWEFDDESRAIRFVLGSSLVDWDKVNLHWQDGNGGAMCGSEEQGEVYALRLALSSCRRCFRALCSKPIEYYYSRQSVFTEWRDHGYERDGIGLASPYTSGKRQPLSL